MRRAAAFQAGDRRAAGNSLKERSGCPRLVPIRGIPAPHLPACAAADGRQSAGLRVHGSTRRAMRKFLCYERRGSTAPRPAGLDRPAGGIRAHLHLRRARPLRGQAHRRPRGRHVRGPHRGTRGDRSAVRRAEAPLHARTALGRALSGSGHQDEFRDGRRGGRPRPPAARLRLPPALRGKRCSEELPVLRSLPDGRLVACHLFDAASSGRPKDPTDWEPTRNGLAQAAGAPSVPPPAPLPTDEPAEKTPPSDRPRTAEPPAEDG